MKVLYVEDDPQDIDLTRRELLRVAPDIALETAGTIAMARMRLRDFESCLSRGAPPPFDLVLLDMNLPDGSGLDVLAEVRRASLSLAVVVLTGSGNEESVLAALRAGADDYLPKRHEYWTQLVDILRFALTKFRSQLVHRARPIRLLYVEPHESDVQLTRRHLATHAPYIILEVVHTAEQALKRLPPDAPPADVDVLLLDYRLPGMNALDALKEVVGIRALDLPVILITGQGSEDVALQALRLGAADYIVKSTGYLFHLPSSVQAAFHRAVAERENAMLIRREEELRQSEYRLDLALEASSLATWEWNLATGAVRFSRHWWPILKYEPDEIPLRIDAWEALTLPEDRAKLNSALAAIVKGSTPLLDIEYRMRAKNGDMRWIRTVGRVVERDAENRVLRMTGTHGDVTSRIAGLQQLRESEAKFRALIEQASDGILILDMQGHFQLVNPRACELLGYDTAELVGLHGTVTYIEDARESFNSRLHSIAEGKSLLFERMMRRKDGSVFPVEISARKVSDNSLQYVFRDISGRREQERKIARLSRIERVRSGINAAIVRIRERQELFGEACRIIVEHGQFSLGWIAVLDHATGTVKAVAQAGLPKVLANSTFFERPSGFAPAGAAEVALREKRPAWDNVIEDAPGEKVASQSDTLIVRRAAIDLGAKSVIVLPLSVEGQTYGMLTLYAAERNFFDGEEIKLLTELAGDISFGLEFIAKEERADYLAYYDTPTGLPNRSLFFDRLTLQIGAATRDHLKVALVLMDLDRFRLVNDTFGKQTGDTLLGSVAQRLKETYRAQDTLARVGADTFAVAVSGAWQATDVARVLETHNRKVFGQAFLLGREALRVSATAGVAMYPDDGDNPETLFANAEAALRKAKEQNAPFLFYGPEMNARLADALRLENKLRLALDNGEMVLWYQPKVDVRTRKITGFEALMRWQDPESGLVPPAKFIPLMEQTGLILEAGRWALLQVARDCRNWDAGAGRLPRIAVNVSPIQLRQKNFVDTVVEAVDQMANAGGALDLEITESTIMESVDAIIPKLQTVSGLGVEIYVDDFGTGYSSLAYIAKLPIQALKIDRSFVIGMAQSKENLTIVQSVISLAHSLRLNVVAEGVETEEQAALLRELGCDEMQGYLISRPVPSDQVPALLRAMT